jgi:serine/threonine protein kinase
MKSLSSDPPEAVQAYHATVSLAIGGYLISRRLARGASTESTVVDNAAHTVRGVAKRLVPRLRTDALARAQLDVEGRVLRALAGRGAPGWLAAGEDEEGPWLVMEYVEAKTLGEWMTPPRDAGFVTPVARGALGALAMVHEAGDGEGPLCVVHGDVSPANLLVGDAARVHVIDFGLASFRDAPAPTTGLVRGTVRYIAPEVARGEPATVQSDLFSLALTLLHASSGETPRPGDAFAALVVQAGELSVTDYATRASRGLLPGLRDALLAAADFDAARRPRSARDMLGAW